MSLRVVLYAEGPGEDRGESPWLAEPGHPLADDSLGAGHILLARTIASVSRIPCAAIQFLSPLRAKGRPHRGSDLTSRARLRQLLTFPGSSRRPDLAIVLVDEDGTGDRREVLIAMTQDLELPHVIGVPVREFEAWLIADNKALASVLPGHTTPTAPETMRPRQAKDLLRNWIAGHPAHQHGVNVPRKLRVALATQIDLDELTKSSSFQRLQTDLRSLLTQLGHA